jgi:hypothetical protein
MINSEDEILVDFRTSCTSEEAVAKMLGWMQGYTRPKSIRITEHGTPADQLSSMQSLGGSLQDQLLELREAARLEFVKAAELGAAFEVIQGKEKAVIECDAMINRAASYLLDIDDEIAKGDASELRIDHSATKNSGVVHITLRSLDRWATKNYGISVTGPLQKFGGQLANDRPDERQDEVSEANGGLGATSTRHLHTTFAFLVEAFSKTATKYHKGDGSPNVMAIAEFLEGAAKESAKAPPMDGQGREAIKKRIAKAMLAKEENLRER